MRSIALLPFLTLVLVLGCKPRHRVDEPVRRGSEDRLEAHRNVVTEFETLVLKGKADIHDEVKNEDISFTYKITIANDSLILANVMKLGLPAANVLINRDSVLMRLPLNKEAIRCDLGMLTEMTGMPVDLKAMQDLITGDMKVPQAAQPAGDGYTMDDQGRQLSYFVGGGHFKLEKMVVKEPTFARELTLEYDDFVKKSGQWIPQSVQLTKTTPATTRIVLKHTDIEIDGEDANFSFRIPEGYTNRPCESK